MVKLIKVIVFVVFAFITGLNVYKAQTEVQLSDIQMKNVEALATGEWLEGSTPCFEDVTWAPNDGSLAVWVTWCEYHCMEGWAVKAENASTCSPL